MKRFMLGILICAAAAACSQPAPPADKQAVAAVAPTKIAVATSDSSTPTAETHIPPLEMTCPDHRVLRVDQEGRVDINGRQAELKAFSATYYEATDAASGVTVSILLNPGKPPSVSYTGRHGVNGVCSRS